ncbi:CENP-Q, a CENPA-CAD centromere complex subunit-domain-containing protein [Emericellopsis atlantica]|uniref:CENP-Q, a CENPA-CAD centromere complex subunit-domain-containing protein n=1 Tax=Emericellopsis atlantica TaxID=2614577 RepID=A0A9P7ZTU9_9HYPO|nr:CENP-Q, a CENPA-CAD centromere complex subunit-domain-containing protein [Emericellopsis atlantica]KAG9257721.1 CENP-Q, a CENPA-CAD centromere complex subunit-domain-containing protein [Emericellopsis atlantica]
MPRKSASPKRKRYSMPVAGDTTLERIDEHESGAAPEETQPKKRGRPKKAALGDTLEQPVEAETETGAPNEAPRRKRGRPSLEEQSRHVQDEPSEERPRKRGRPPHRREQPATDDAKPRRKRGRPSLGEKSHSELNEDVGAVDQSAGNNALEVELTPETTKSRRGRPKKALPTQSRDEEAVLEQEEDHRDSTTASRQRQSRHQEPAHEEPEQSQEEEEGHPAAATRKRGQRKKATRQAEEEGERQEGSPPPAKRKRGRPSLNAAEEPSSTSHATTSKPTSKPVEEQQPSGDAQSLEENLAIVRHYNDILPRSHPRLVPKDRTLSKAEIDEKWAPLAGPALEAATELLVPAGHATINALPLGTTRRKHTEAAVAGIQRRLMAYTSRMPFPPSSSGMRRKAKKRGGLPEEYETEFDYEYVYDRTTNLQAQLDAAQCAVEVLQRERDKEERALERDYKVLQSLEASAKAEKRDAREMIKKAHVLAPDSRRAVEDEYGLVVDGKTQPSLQNLEDEEVKELAMQLSGHMDSIRTNMAQLDGLSPQLERSSAALRSVLARHLSAEEYHRVLFN